MGDDSGTSLRGLKDYSPCLCSSALGVGMKASGTDDPCSALDLQERERLRIGFDLHDGPAQTMAGALLQVRMLEDAEGDTLRSGLRELHGILTAALEEMYAIIGELGDRFLESEGLAGPIRDYVLSFTERTGLDVKFFVDGTEVPVTRSMRIAVFRIVQEALSNVRCHARAMHAEVRLVLSETEVWCVVSDDGCGFVPDDTPAPGARRECYGLRGMRDRAGLLGGTCTVTSAPGQGATVSARIPVWQA